MHALLSPIIEVIVFALDLYRDVVIVAWIMGMLIAFNIINTRSQIVYTIVDVLNRMTEPALRQIRRVVPVVGGMDFSIMVLLLLIYLVQRYMVMLFLNFRPLP